MGNATLPTTKTAQDKQTFEQRLKPLFEQVKQLMSNPPPVVREAGRMLDDPVQGYTNAAIRHRAAQLMRALHRLGYKARRQAETPLCTRADLRMRCGLPARTRRAKCRDDGRYYRVPEPKSVRFQLAFRETLERLRDRPFDQRVKADRFRMAGLVMLLTWLLCDPDAHDQQPLLTELQDWSWDSDFDVLKRVKPGEEVIWIANRRPIPLADRLVGRYWLRTELEDKDHLHDLWLTQLRKALEVLAEAAEGGGHLPEGASQQAGDVAEAGQHQGQASLTPEVHGSASKAAANASGMSPEANDPPRGQGRTADRLSWRQVQQKLERMRKAGLPYTNHSELSRRLGCSQSTVQKAFRPPLESLNMLPTDEERKAAREAARRLQAWAKLAQLTKPNGGGTRPAVPLNEHHLATAAQQTESDPADQMSDDEVDAVIAQVMDRATPEERAKLNALDKEGRRRLVEVFLDQQRDGDRLYKRI